MSDAVQPGELPFLSRWSKKKTESTDANRDAPSEAGQLSETIPNPSTGEPFGAKNLETPLPEPISPTDSENEPASTPELPSIDSLTHESDFTGFMAKEVDPGLRNQAMKKLFTDPHYQFEQMDKLDIYLDDYSKSEPIPTDVLRRMYQSKSLFLFDDEEKENVASGAAGQIANGTRAADQNPVSTEQIAEADSQVLLDDTPLHTALPSSENTDDGGQLQVEAPLAIMKPSMP